MRSLSEEEEESRREMEGFRWRMNSQSSVKRRMLVSYTRRSDICISEITGWFSHPRSRRDRIYVMHSRFRTRNRCERGRRWGAERGAGAKYDEGQRREKNDTGLRTPWMTLYISPLICRHAQSRPFVSAGSTAVSQSSSQSEQSVSGPRLAPSRFVGLTHLGVVCTPRVCENRTRLACASSLFGRSPRSAAKFSVSSVNTL